MERRLTPELMDDPGADPGELRRALGYIRVVNRRLGGVGALIGHLERWSARWPRDRAVTLVDIGTGSADLPIAAVEWARGAGFDLRVTGVDVHAETLRVAGEQVEGAGLGEAITLVEGDALGLMDRFEPGSFDYAHAGLFLHHLPEIEVMTALRIMERLASKGIVWNDLMRTRVGRAVIGVLTIGQPEMVRHDARVSVEAGFTKREVMDYRQRLGLGWCAYRSSVLTHRFTLAGEKAGAWALGG